MKLPQSLTHIEEIAWKLNILLEQFENISFHDRQKPWKNYVKFSTLAPAMHEFRFWVVFFSVISTSTLNFLNENFDVEMLQAKTSCTTD